MVKPDELAATLGSIRGDGDSDDDDGYEDDGVSEDI
jgi:hypothetical protein